MSEIHLIIIWDKARLKVDAIESDVCKQFEVVKIYEIEWGQERFADNLSRFYGKNLPPGSKKEAEVGTGPFLLYVVRDTRPRYAVRRTSKGNKLVNTNLFDSKMRYREWTTPGEKIKSTVHATNDVSESKVDLILLTGQSYSLFMSMPPQVDSAVEKRNANLFGSNGWDSLKDPFSVLNDGCNYVVLRNFTDLFNQPISEEHSDIDLLVESYDDARRLLDATEVFAEKFRVQNKVAIDGLRLSFDLRYVGDGYLDGGWQKNILRNRVLANNGFYVPCDEDFFYSLIYHAVVNKNRIASNYIDELGVVGNRLLLDTNAKGFFESTNLREIMECFMEKRGYQYIAPKDLSVRYRMHSYGGYLHTVKKKMYKRKLHFQRFLARI